MTRSVPVSMPPDPNTRTPSWTLPKGACDTHAHVFRPPDVFPLRRSAAVTRRRPHRSSITATCRALPASAGPFLSPDGAWIRQSRHSQRRCHPGRFCVWASPTSTPLRLQGACRLGRGRHPRRALPFDEDRPGSVDDLRQHLPALQRLDWMLDLHVDPPDFIEHERFIRTLPDGDHHRPHGTRPGNDGLDQPAFRLLLDLLKDDRFWVKLCSFDKISGCAKARSREVCLTWTWSPSHRRSSQRRRTV